jgi:hypothetical protein
LKHPNQLTSELQFFITSWYDYDGRSVTKQLKSDLHYC